MTTRAKIVWLLFPGLGIAALGGCPFSQGRTSDGGGGNLLTAFAKVTGGNMTSLTEDEIQIASDLVIQNGDVPIEPLSNEQADAVVDFLKANNINRPEDIQALVDNPDAVEVPETTQMLIEALGAEAARQQASADANP